MLRAGSVWDPSTHNARDEGWSTTASGAIDDGDQEDDAIHPDTEACAPPEQSRSALANASPAHAEERQASQAASPDAQGRRGAPDETDEYADYVEDLDDDRVSSAASDRISGLSESQVWMPSVAAELLAYAALE
jgi:hypothetical protein